MIFQYLFYNNMAPLGMESLTPLTQNYFSGTPYRDICCFYPCEIFLSHIATHTRWSDPYVSSLLEKSFSHTKVYKIKWSLC